MIDQYAKKQGCGFKVTSTKFEPPDGKKGDIARIYLYMNDKYLDLKILPQDKVEMFLSWHKNDPVSVEEKIYNQRIYKIQGDFNPYIENIQITK